MRAERVVVKTEKEQQQHRWPEECHGEKRGHAPSEHAPLDDESGHGEERPEYGKLHEQLAAEKAEETQPVEPVGGNRMVDPGVSLAPDEEQDFMDRFERTVEADRQWLPRAAHHPGIGREAHDHQYEETAKAMEQGLALRPKEDEERRRDEQHQRIVVAEAEPENERHPGQQARRTLQSHEDQHG